MYWRLNRREFQAGKGAGNRRALKALVSGKRAPGLIGYVAGLPVAWCAVAPRQDYPRLAHSRILRAADEQPVWSIGCLFIARPYRNTGLSVKMIEAAVEFVRKRRGTVVEAYPVEPGEERIPDAFAWTGIASAFRRAGFVECTRRSATRPVMRNVISAGARVVSRK